MRIIDLQRRLREIGRIRIGEQVPTSNGKTRPAKLQHFRLTSRDKTVIEAAADTYGGKVEPWTAPDGQQWEVKTTVEQMSVIVPPNDMAFSQAYEQWTAGGCRVRCDGQFDHVGDTDCHCDPANRACDIHTRLSIMLPDLPGVGVWRLDTQSYYAAVELGGIVELCAAVSATGAMLPARLRLEQRSVKRFDPNGKPVTLRFVVPVLDLDVHPLALGAGSIAPAALPETSRLALTPVPPSDVPPPPLSEQIAQVNDPKPRKARANAQAPIPASGIKPRPVGRGTGSPGGTPPPAAEEQPTDAPVRVPSGSSDDDVIDAVLVNEPPPRACVRCGGDITDGRLVVRGEGGMVCKEPCTPDTRPTVTARDIGILAGKAFPLDDVPRGTKTATRDRLRYAAAYIVTEGARWHVADLNAADMTSLATWLENVTAGRIGWTYDDSGVTFTLDGRDVTVPWAAIEPASVPA